MLFRSRNNNRKARGTNTAELRNFRKNDPTKVNNNDKPREKVIQSSNNSMDLSVLDVKSMVT